MKLLRLLLVVVLAVALAGGQSVNNKGTKEQDSQTTSVTGTTLIFQDSLGTQTNSFEMIPTGAPASVTVTIDGCMRGGTCNLGIGSSSSTTGGIINLTMTGGPYDRYIVHVAFTGGTNPALTFNRTGTAARNGSGSSGSFVSNGPGDFVLSPNCPQSNANNCFFTPANTQQVTDCSWSNTSTTVNCTASHFVAGDVGKRIFGFGTCATNQALASYTNTLGATAQGAVTITQVNSGTQVIVSQATTGAQTAPSCVMWGNLDDTGISAADAAATSSPYCATIELPIGRMLIQQPHFNTTSNACLNNASVLGATYLEWGYTIKGYATAASIITITPDFNFAATVCATGCFAHGPGSVWSQWTLDGGGLILASAGPSFFLFKPSTPGANFPFALFDHFNCTNIGMRDVNSSLFNMNSGITLIFTEYSTFDGCAAITEVGDGTHNAFLITLNSAFEDQAGVQCAVCTTITAPFVVTANSELRSLGGNAFAGGPVATSGSEVLVLNMGGTVRLATGDDLNPANGSASIVATYGTAGTGCVTYATNTPFGASNANPPNTTNVAYSIICTNDQSYISGSSFFGGSAGQAISVQAAGGGAVFHDLGGNVIQQGTVKVTTGNSYAADGANVSGACTGVGTAASTLGLYGTGPNVVATTCTSVLIGSGVQMQRPGTLRSLYASATAAGTNASSGVVTVLKNGAAQTLTCTIGTGTFCNDSTHSVTFASGDLISLQFTTQAADTLAGVKAAVIQF